MVLDYTVKARLLFRLIAIILVGDPTGSLLRAVPYLRPCSCAGFCPAAHCRHDANLGVAANRTLQNLIAAHDFTVDEDVDVRPHVTLLGQYAIA